MFGSEVDCWLVQVGWFKKFVCLVGWLVGESAKIKRIYPRITGSHVFCFPTQCAAPDKKAVGIILKPLV